MTKDQFITNAIVEGKAATLKDAMKLWKAYREENGISRADSIAARFYAELKEGIMDDESFEEWISEQSDNAQKHKSHYNGIRKLANEIHKMYK